jgi:hypothetical protein
MRADVPVRNTRVVTLSPSKVMCVPAGMAAPVEATQVAVPSAS